MLRWMLWTLFAIAWTAALELPVPEPTQLPAGEIILTYRILIAKGAHVAAYALFTVLSAWAAVPQRYRWLMMLFLTGHAWGGEMMQSVLEPYCHRGGHLSDVGLDLLGILIGAALTWRWWVRE